jgi:heme/copper-type cytochrome/quinol oxidase subunit 3
MTADTITLPREDPRARVNATLGMIFFIGSWSMAFGTLFLSFVILRNRFAVWPPTGITLPSFPMAAVATGVLIASSLALHLSVRRCEQGRTGFASLWLLGLGLGAAFAGLQVWLWADLMLAGRLPESGLYESLFYGLTWVHAAHVAIGWLVLAWAQLGMATGRYGRHRISTVSNAAIFWHFVDVVWILLFLGFFVF